MQKRIRLSAMQAIAGLVFALYLTSCGTRPPRQYDFQALAHAAIELEMDIDEQDNHALYIESAKWLGVPYRYGGSSLSGTDCSGFTASVYRTVFRKKLKRNAEEQRTANCRKIARQNLKEGDLVFFHNGKRKRTANHVGIYLKDGKFIHASTSQGVVVSRLTEAYYSKRWMQGGRVHGL